MGHLLILITASSQEEAQRIARVLVEERLAACVNIVPAVRSVYRWQGQIHDDQEVLLTAKTTEQMFQALATRTRQLHSYEVPEIVALPIVAAGEDYLRWIDEQTRQTSQ
jgi:periplasmic divalent cation tolerance protein